MDVHKLDKIFKPKRIALIGVTSNPKSVGGKILRNLVTGGFQGVVYPVNIDFEAVQGIQCFAQLRDIPKQADLGIICSPAPQVPDLVRQCGEANIKGLIIISAGFKEIGEIGAKLEEQIHTELQRFPDMRIIGPNCLGIIIPGLKLNASFSTGLPKKGNIAFISQSGALCASVLDWALDKNIGFSYFVSIGNTLDVDFGDLIDYFGEDENTHSIILYIESINRVRSFMTAARAYARAKPIIVYKSGKFKASAEVAASHTGAMATEDSIYDAAFQRMGISRISEIGEIFDYTEMMGCKKTPKGPKVCIITNAGGPGVIATDALIANNGVLAEMSEETLEQLNLKLPAFWSHGNPVDVLGDARPKRIAKVLDIILQDSGVDAVLLILTPQAMTNPSGTARAVVQCAEKTKKPILASWMGGKSMRESYQIFNDACIPVYDTPDKAVRAFMILVQYSRNLEILYETPKYIPVKFKVDRKQVKNEFFKLIPDDTNILSEELSKHLIQAYGMPVTMPVPVSNENEALQQARKMGFPVVLKINSPEITHKTDVGGVALNLKDEAMVKRGYADIIKNAHKANPKAAINGVTVQPMIQEKNAVELILGIKKDRVFGTVMLVGMGGIQAEFFKDSCLGFPPLNERLARSLLESLKIWPLLNGYRGAPAVNIKRLIEMLIRLSYLAADYPEIKELDINPLLVYEKDIIALDARIVLDRKILDKPLKPYSHLMLRPYPEEYVKRVKLRDKSAVILRPIKPEDEQIWMDMLASCSPESIYARFQSLYTGWKYHKEAIRYCYIDYAREIAIVAEVKDKQKRRLIGVGRLIADPDVKNAEYAVLIADPWQNQGLGKTLTDYCLEIAKEWGIKEVVAQTSTTNNRMVEIFKESNFEITIDHSNSEVYVKKTLI